MKLHVKNFGPIREAKVEIRPMTVFVGHSNTGKSYLAMLVYCIAQALVMVNKRELVVNNFPNYLMRKLMTKRPRKGTLTDEIDEGKFLDEESVRSVIHGVLVTYLGKIKREWEDKMSFCFGMGWSITANIDKQATFSFLIIDEANEITFDLLPDKNEFKVPDIFVEKITEKLETKLKKILEEKRAAELKIKSKGNNSPQPLMSDSILSEVYNNDSPINIFKIIFDSLDFSSSHIDDYPDERTQNKVHYLPAGRGTIMDSYLPIVSQIISNVNPDYSDGSSFSGVTLNFLQKLMSIKDLLNISEEGKKIAIYADKMERRITKGRIKLRISKTGCPHFNYTLENIKQGDIPLTKASSAVSELAAIILFIRYHLSRGDIFIIEEPEANLHTTAQREIAALLVELVNAGVYVLITTHSDVVLEQISNCMQASRLPKGSKIKVLHNAKLVPEKINAYTFVETKRGTKVQLVPPDTEDLDILSEDHTDVSSDLYNESVRIYNATHKNGN